VEIVTDNGSAFVAATDYLADKYGIPHIRISPYNLHTNGLVETKHFVVREAIMKTCDNKVSHWPYMAPLVFWANQVTIQKSTGHSPFFLAHGIEVVLPFDVAEATYLLPLIEIPTSTESLIVYQAKQLQKHPEELRDIAARILKAHQQSVAQFVKSHATTIHDYDFQKSSLVLVCNSCIKKELNRKTKIHYPGLMVVIHCTKGGGYFLVEVNGAVSKLCYAAFHLIPYLACSQSNIPISRILNKK